MYSEIAIASLVNRIGFGRADTIDIEVDPVHTTGTSGRTLPFFHKLATLKNIYNTAEKPVMTSVEFNDFLAQMKLDAVKGALSAILDRHTEYQPDEDYSDLILTRPGIFDDAIGYTLASTVVEQLISTSRSNYLESSAKLSYQQLKMEIDGVVDDSGRIRVKGLKREQLYAVKQAISAIFKGKVQIFDATDVW